MADEHAPPFRQTLVVYYDVESMAEPTFLAFHTKVMDLATEAGIQMKYNLWDADQLKVTIREEPK